MTAKPITRKSAGSLVLEDALDGLSSLAQGYLSREQVLHKRRMEEREYAFRREQFETSKDQWQTSFNENMRQFDQQMDFSQQTHEERLAHNVEMQEARIDAQADIQRKARGVQYHRIKVQKEQAYAGLQARYHEAGQRVSDLELIGPNPSFQVANGQFPINDVDWARALDDYANGISAAGGPLLFSEQMTPEFAKGFHQQIIDGVDIHTLVNRLDRAGLLSEPLQDNEQTLGMLESIAIKANDGGLEEEWRKRSQSERSELIANEARNVEMLPELIKESDARKQEMMRAEWELKNDRGGYGPWGNIDNAESDAYAASNIHIRRSTDSTGRNLPVLNLSTFPASHQPMAQTAYDMMLDATGWIGTLEEQWANEDYSVDRGEMDQSAATSQRDRNRGRARYKEQIDNQLGVLDTAAAAGGGAGMDRKQQQALRDYFQGVVKGEAPTFPYQAPGTGTGRAAGNARLESREGKTYAVGQGPSPSEIKAREDANMKEFIGVDVSPDQWETEMAKSPVSNSIISGAKGARLTPDDIFRLSARYGALIQGVQPATPTEQRVIEGILAKAGVPLQEVPNAE